MDKINKTFNSRQRTTKPFFVLLWLIIAAVVMVSCQNPFSPLKREPVSPLLPNRTPANLLRNLEIAYSLQSLSLFMSLLSSDYRFVVSQNFVPENPDTKLRVKSEDIDGDSLLETYWNRDWEEEDHKRIFEKAKQITLILPCPDCEDSTKWAPWIDIQTGKQKGIIVKSYYPTLYLTNQRDKRWELNPSIQLFCLKKNPADTTLWLIGEWHEE